MKGRLIADGGPAPGLPRSAEGTITVSGHGIFRSQKVGKTGLFTFALPNGSCTVSGHQTDANESTCTTNPIGRVRVIARRISVIHVVCSIR